MIDHAADVALPSKLAPLKVIAVGVADWQVVIALPAVTIGDAATVIAAVAVRVLVHEGAVLYPMSTKVTVVLVVSAGVVTEADPVPPMVIAWVGPEPIL